MNLKLTIVAAALFAGLTATAAFAEGGNAFPRFEPRMPPPNPCKVIYLSDYYPAQRDNLYSSLSPFLSYSPLPQLPAVDNGWGLWATSGKIYAGEYPNKINIYKPCSNKTAGSLTTAGQGPPTSIAALGTNTYATEYGSQDIDWFSGSTDHPGAYDSAPRGGGQPFYLAVDSLGNVYVSGWNANLNAEQVDRCGPHMVGCALCETILGGPGGVVLDAFNNLIVNSETGTLYVFLAGCPAGPYSSYYYGVVGSNTYSFTDITLDKAENRIWGANLFNESSLDAQAVPYFPSATTPHFGPLVPADHTPILTNQYPGTGIAVSPPGPN